LPKVEENTKLGKALAKGYKPSKGP